MSLRLYPAADPRHPVTFVSIDALAAHLVRQRPGREVVAWPMQATDGLRDFAVLSLWAAPAPLVAALRDALALARLAAAFADPDASLAPVAATDLGLSEGATLDQIDAALRRVRTAGGLAA